MTFRSASRHLAAPHHVFSLHDRIGSNCDIDAGCDGNSDPKADARHGSNEARPD